MIQRAAITRVRPAFEIGWRLGFSILVNTPQYLQPERLVELLNECGKLNGFCDFRPSYGRFVVTKFEPKDFDPKKGA